MGNHKKFIYRKSVNFPILTKWLASLQRFTGEEKPHMIWPILRDKSDTKEMSQFLVAVVFGFFALVLATASTILTAVQIAYTIKSYSIKAAPPSSI
ncbi:hypothetical protein F5Y09DRAFT_325769 [Xylaria sp. FL1042]|nr:hypothetical protein F5Y09DRAFT_325769 [Xylaria sp. FL1042]